MTAATTADLDKLQKWLDFRLERLENLFVQRFSQNVELPGSSPTPARDIESHSKEGRSKADSDNQLQKTATAPSEPLGLPCTMPLPGSLEDSSGSKSKSDAQTVHKSVSSKDSWTKQGGTASKRNLSMPMGVTKELSNDRVSSISKCETTPLEERDWQVRLMDVFDNLDLDMSGNINLDEFIAVFTEVGMPHDEAGEIFKTMDKGKTGYISRMEWLYIIEEAARGSDENAVSRLCTLSKFLDRLARRLAKRGSIYQSDRTRKHFLIIRHDSAFRMAWDLLLMALMFYVSLTMPFQLGFGDDKLLGIIDFIVDVIFCIDLCLNFRTSYVFRDEEIVQDGKKIAWRYLKSWFILDFVSSFPFDAISAGFFPDLTIFRILKVGKVMRVMKLLKLSKMMAHFKSNKRSGVLALVDYIEERTTSPFPVTIVSISKLALLAFIVAHWLGCFGAAVDKTSLEDYFSSKPGGASIMQQYLAAIYWAMTTLSTVGYGDITPKTDEERLYAMFAMVVGGSLYGYVIGCVTSMVTAKDLHSQAYLEKMELYQGWLDRKVNEIPKWLRTRIRKHLKKSLLAMAAVEDSTVITELSNELRGWTAHYLVHDCVRNHPMFSQMDRSVLAKLVEVLKTMHTSHNEKVVTMGDPGTAMYILTEGVARYDEGIKFEGGTGEATTSKRFQQVVLGDSFGEEILFGMREMYDYTISSTTDCLFQTIREDDFRERYEHMPELRKSMYEGFVRSRGLQPE